MDNHNTIIVRRGRPEDAQKFSELLLMAGKLLPVLYGKKTTQLVQSLFRQPQNLYSYEHTYFAEFEGKIAGMIQGYPFEISQCEQARTRELIISVLKFSYFLKIGKLLTVYKSLGGMEPDEYYISYAATYPNLRQKGIGKLLFDAAAQEGAQHGASKVVFDVRTDNTAAIASFQKFGYVIERTKPAFYVGNQRFEYHKMTLYLHSS